MHEAEACDWVGVAFACCNRIWRSYGQQKATKGNCPLWVYIRCTEKGLRSDTGSPSTYASFRPDCLLTRRSHKRSRLVLSSIRMHSLASARLGHMRTRQLAFNLSRTAPFEKILRPRLPRLQHLRTDMLSCPTTTPRDQAARLVYDQHAYVRFAPRSWHQRRYACEGATTVNLWRSTSTRIYTRSVAVLFLLLQPVSFSALQPG